MRELGRIDAAERVFADAAKKAPNLWGGWRGLGRVCRQTGRHAEALGHFRRASVSNPKISGLLGIGIAKKLLEKGQNEEAEKPIEQILNKDDQNYGLAWRGLG